MFLHLSTELLNMGYRIRFRPGGHSMNPTIRDGESVVVEPVRALEVLRGDIILYRQPSRVVAHRIISLKGSDETHRAFIIRGDALIRWFELVRADRTLGSIVA